MLFKKSIVCFFLIVLMVLSSNTVNAATTESYIRTDVPGGTEIKISKEMYTATSDITAATLGIEEELSGITDIFCDESGIIYILCGDISKLYRLNTDYSLDGEIIVTDDNGMVDFRGASGIYCDKNENMFIADTIHSRVLVCNTSGVVKKVLETPNSDLIPDDFLFQPTTVQKDINGYTYILSLGCYYGALLYNPEYEFMGFYGANTVKATARDTFSYLWDKLISTEEKKASSVKTLPYSFTDFSVDEQGFMITLTGSVSSNKFAVSDLLGHIRKISYDGSNILYKRKLDGTTVSSTNLNFLESERPENTDVQDLCSIAISKDGYIFVLDNGNGTIYIYDNECNLMAAFGGGYHSGEQLGVFKDAVAISLKGNTVLVADAAKCSVTIFEPTEYGNLLRKAQSLYLSGNYGEAKNTWIDVISLNRNCQLAYRGLAMVYYNEGNYSEALEAARISMDRSVYDLAWNKIVSQFVADHFVILVAVLSIIVIGAIFFFSYLKKKGKKLITNDKIKLLFNVPFHPFNSFDDLKYKKMGSVKISIIITILFYISSVLNVIAPGFLYSNTLLRNYNSLYTLIGTVGLLLLWSVSNWLVCTIFLGKGTFKEVYVSSSYVILPYIVFNFLKVILTNFIPLSGAGLINGIETVLLIYTFFVLSVAIMKIHEFDFFKFILTSFVTIFFMILIMFIIFMCGILIAQFGAFIISIYKEVAYR